MVQSLSCYFEPEHKQFYSVIHLGTDICGYKRIVHGKAPSTLLKLSDTACLHAMGHLVSHVLVHSQVDSQLQCVTKPLAGSCLLSGFAMLHIGL